MNTYIMIYLHICYEISKIQSILLHCKLRKNSGVPAYIYLNSQNLYLLIYKRIFEKYFNTYYFYKSITHG